MLSVIPLFGSKANSRSLSKFKLNGGRNPPGSLLAPFDMRSEVCGSL